MKYFMFILAMMAGGAQAAESNCTLSALITSNTGDGLITCITADSQALPVEAVRVALMQPTADGEFNFVADGISTPELMYERLAVSGIIVAPAADVNALNSEDSVNATQAQYVGNVLRCNPLSPLYDPYYCGYDYGWGGGYQGGGYYGGGRGGRGHEGGRDGGRGGGGHGGGGHHR